MLWYVGIVPRDCKSSVAHTVARIKQQNLACHPDLTTAVVEKPLQRVIKKKI